MIRTACIGSTCSTPSWPRIGSHACRAGSCHTSSCVVAAQRTVLTAQANNLDVLLARLIHHDLLSDALKLAIDSLKSATAIRTTTAGLDRLPYALFDQLLSVVLDPSDAADAACAAQQEELRTAVAARIALAGKQTGSLRARVGR